MPANQCVCGRTTKGVFAIDYVYIIGSSNHDGYPSDERWDWIQALFISLRSLARHSDCALICRWNKPYRVTVATIAASFKGPVIMREIPDDKWIGQMAINKVPDLSDVPVKDGDRLIMMDLDTIVKKDVFTVFDDDFDIGYTTRPEPNPEYPVNDGVWALRINPKTRRFLKWYKKQVNKPTWDQLIALEGMRGHLGRRDMFPDQDVMCACVIHGFPFDLKGHDLGPKWNWFASDSDQLPFESYKERAKDCGVLHFKGQHKHLMLEPEMDWPRNIEFEITLRCNISCPTCNRHCNVYGDNSDTDMTMEQVHRFISDVKNSGRKYEYISLIGGEPLLHPDVEEIALALQEELVLPGHVTAIRMVTNGILPVPEIVRDLCSHIWVSEHKTKSHYEAFISPMDSRQTRCPCSVLRNCGIALNCFGYSPCGPGGGIARLFGMKQYIQKEMPEFPSDFGDLEPLCSLCQRATTCPVILPPGKPATWSKTYTAALDRYNADPPVYEIW